MKLSKVEAGKNTGEDSANGKLLSEIETISKALYMDKTSSRKSIATSSTRPYATGKTTQFLDSKSSFRYGKDDPSLGKDKKSIWNWRPLKALSQVKSRKFNCSFSLQVHCIEGLPPRFDNVSVRVHWKRRDGELVTRPVKVLEGIAEFDEKLIHTCMVYGSRSGPHHSAKYESKHFLLYASVFGAQDLDLGKHRVDLTRLLPLTLEELEEEKSSGEWTTSYKLSGEAKGATMNVSFGYMVVGDSPSSPRNIQSVPDLLNVRTVKPVQKFGQTNLKSTMRRTGSLPGTLNQRHALSRTVEDIKDLHEVLPTSKSKLDTSTSMVHHKLDDGKLDAFINFKPEMVVLTEHVEPTIPQSRSVSDSSQKIVENECDDAEFSVIEQGMEMSPDEQNKTDEVTMTAADVSTVDVKVDDISVALQEAAALHSEDIGNGSCEDELVVHDCSLKRDDIYSKESVMKDLEYALDNQSKLETEALESPEEKENYIGVESDYETNKERSHSFDDLTKSVANEFLDMLGIEHSPFGLSSESEPESPRERLLKQFEKEALAGGYSLFDFNAVNGDDRECDYGASTSSEWGNLSKVFELSSVIHASKEHQTGTQAASSKTRAKMLEDLETEALMREWGLNDKAFQYSPPKNSGSFGSPIDLPPEQPPELPPLGEGLGPFLQTKNGGFVRSMNPSLFMNAKSGGSLIMQVSSPVVVPAEMGSGIMDILQQLASVGIEKLSMQANKLMPLEDITGKTMQQVAWEAGSALEGPGSFVSGQSSLQHELEMGQDVSIGQKNMKAKSSAPTSNKLGSGSATCDMGSEYVSIEDLAPLAMDKIEALSIEGLRIQSGMSDEDAPSNISAKSIGEISALQGKGINVSGSLGLEGAAGLQLLDIKDGGDDLDGLMGLSLTLDEWMRLDSGDIGDEDEISERTSKILAAHHASSLDMIRGGSKGERRRGKGSGRKCGLLGNNFTVALMVQLRDPLRNFEPVGTPMLALIQVERVFVPPKPRIYRKVSEFRSSNEEDDESDSLVKKEEVKEENREEKVSGEEKIPQFRITEVHVAGLKAEPGKKKLWGTTNQQQSGSRWLLANGMGKNNKHPFMKSKAVPAKSATPSTMKVQPGDTLWSISSRVHGTGDKWKELAALNPHIRNPNVIFPNQTIRLR